MSLNLSGGQLGRSDLVEMVASALQEADLKAAHLQLEMTESVLMDDAATTINILQTLKGLGVHLGVDDFGTGYSSLAYLKRFPVDCLKIDRSFVNALGKDVEDSAIVAAVVSLADTLGLTPSPKVSRPSCNGIASSRSVADAPRGSSMPAPSPPRRLRPLSTVLQRRRAPQRDRTARC